MDGLAAARRHRHRRQGLAGLEYSLDKYLAAATASAGSPRTRSATRSSCATTSRTEPGADIRLTLDASVQDRAEEVLAEVGEEWKPKGATAIVMDPRDGAILALANWPQVNANAPGDAPDYARQNRAIGATYEPGSTFKAFTVAGALEEGEVTPDTSSTSRRRSRSPTARSARRTTPATARSPRARSSSSPPTSARS